MQKKNKNIKANWPRNVFIAVTLLFVYRYIKAFWESSLDMEVFRYYKLDYFAYFLSVSIILSMFLALWGIFKRRVWWFKAFLLGIFFLFLDTSLVVLCLACDQSALSIIYAKSPLVDRLDWNSLQGFFALKYLLIYLLFILVFLTVLLCAAYKNQEKIIEK